MPKNLYEPRSKAIWHCVIILFVAGAIFFVNLGQSRLWDRDEPRNAGCAAEMMARGDWVVPIFNDELRHQKPVLLYWLVMSAYWVLGVNEFSARFWSAALAVGTTLMTYALVRRLAGATTGLIAGIALSTSLMFCVAARAVTPDSVLIFFSTMAMMLYVLGTFPSSSNSGSSHSISHASYLGDTKQLKAWFPQNKWFVIGMYVAMGLGVLAKGPVGFLLPMAMIGMFMLIQRLPASGTKKPSSVSKAVAGMLLSCVRPFHPIHFSKTLWAMCPILAAAIVLLIAAPWFLLVDARTDGDFTRLFFVGEHFGRATTVLEDHSGGIWFYPLAILVGFFPWSVLWGPVLVAFLFGKKPFDTKAVGTQDLDANGESSFENPANPIRIANTFFLCWIAVQVGAFSLVQTKLPSYVTPCYPALAGLAAICLVSLSRTRESIVGVNSGEAGVHAGWYHAAFGGLVLSGVMIAAGFWYAASSFFPGQIWLAAIGLIPVFTGVALIVCLLCRQSKKIPSLFAAGAFAFALCLFGFGTVSLDREQQSHVLMQEIKLNPKAAVASFGVLESSWVFYANRPIHEIGESDLSQSDRLFWKPKPRASVEAFLKQNSEAMFITTEEEFDSLKNRLPDDFEILQTADYFLKNKRLYLVGRKLRVADSRLP